VRSKDGHNEHAAQPVQCFLRADSHAAHFRKRTGKRAALAAGLPAQSQGNAAALAVVGFSQVDELEVKREGARQQDRALGGQRMHQLQRRGRMQRGFLFQAAGFRVAAANGALAQRLHMGKQVFTGLLAQDIAEQCAERTHVAAQRSFLQVAGLRLQLGKPLRPALGVPQKDHRTSIMHERL